MCLNPLLSWVALKANIISRSEDQDFRAACRALIKAGKKAMNLFKCQGVLQLEQAGTADVDTMPTQGRTSRILVI